MRVDEHTIELDGSPVFYRSSGTGTLFLHGIPTSSDDWLPFLEQIAGVAPDLIGFGRSGKGGHLEYSPTSHAEFIEALLAHLGIDRVALVLSDWGAAGGLEFARRHPARIERLVLINALPLSRAAVWPRLASAWRKPVVGELVMGSITKWLFKRQMRKGGEWSAAQLSALWAQFDQGTQRAILRLHRSISGPADLGAIDAQALVLWGEEDPWLPPEVGETYAASLPNASLERIPGAGHWPWLDQPSVIDRVAAFLRAPR